MNITNSISSQLDTWVLTQEQPGFGCPKLKHRAHLVFVFSEVKTIRKKLLRRRHLY